jgi:hypothetical protein
MQARLAHQRPSRGLTLISLFAAAAATLILGLQVGLTFNAPVVVQQPGKVIVLPAAESTADWCYMAPRNFVC